jgi:hypothetical protein
MKKRIHTKLQLSRETLLSLESTSLRRIRGGAATTSECLIESECHCGTDGGGGTGSTITSALCQYGSNC